MTPSLACAFLSAAGALQGLARGASSCRGHKGEGRPQLLSGSLMYSVEVLMDPPKGHKYGRALQRKVTGNRGSKEP